MPNSNYYSILQAVQNQIMAVVPNTVVRRKLYRLESDVFPMVYVVPEVPPGEKIVQLTFSNNVILDYPVIVTYAQAGASDLTTGLDTFLYIRQSIRHALYHPLLNGVAAVWDTNYDPDPVLRFAELLGGDYDVTGWRFLFRTKEVWAAQS